MIAKTSKQTSAVKKTVAPKAAISKPRTQTKLETISPLVGEKPAQRFGRFGFRKA